MGQPNKDYLAEALIQFDLLIKDNYLTPGHAQVMMLEIADNILSEFTEDLKAILFKELDQAIELGELRIAKRNK